MLVVTRNTYLLVQSEPSAAADVNHYRACTSIFYEFRLKLNKAHECEWNLKVSLSLISLAIVSNQQMFFSDLCTGYYLPLLLVLGM